MDRQTPEMEMLSKEEIQQIKTESEESTLTKENQDVQRLLRHWTEYSPKMTKRLKSQGILTQYAIVTQDRFNQAVMQLTNNSGMAMSEAELTCEGMLLLDPEEPEQTEEPTESLTDED